MTQPVQPKDAASLVLVRQTDAGLAVLLGRRAAKHRFMPQMYAFPGGRVDRDDMLGTPHKSLPPHMNRHVTQAVAMAAVRETWEETGIALGPVEAGRLRPDLSGLRYLCRAITPPESPIRYHARFFLQDLTGRDPAQETPLAGSGELLDLAFRPIEAALRLPLVDITEFVLRLVAQLGPDLTPRKAAFWRYRAGKPMIRWENP